jgi:glucosyl-3-phosphoglycerate synthase
MKSDVKRIPFDQVIVPVFSDVKSNLALEFAKLLNTEITLLGLLPAPADEPLSAVASKASEFRSEIFNLHGMDASMLHISVRVGQHLLNELCSVISENPENLLVLEWPAHFEAMKCLPFDVLEASSSNIVIVRGPWPKDIRSVVLPLRGGPNAELALRLSRFLPHKKLSVINYRYAAAEVEPAFRGLLRVLQGMPDVNFQQTITMDLEKSILDEAGKVDLLVMGASGRSRERQGAVGSLLEEVLQQADSAVIAIKAAEPTRDSWTGVEGELAGSGAISLLVDRWFAENTYHSREFENLENLVELKQDQGLTISLALPALNEEKTVGNVINTVKTALMDEVPLLDEIVLIDSRSTDRTREIAAEYGIPVYIHQDLLPQYGERTGKGEALWKSLFVTRGDIVVWIDTDIVNIHPRFVYGVIGPMLVNPNVQYVKGFYRRPLRVGEKVQAGGGGRVTELTARPLLNLFYPELSGVIQPLSGEYGGRREALEQVTFFSGYGVETGMLIEIFEKYGLSGIAQVDLLKRVHHNQELQALSKMAFVILQAFIRRLEYREKVKILEDVNRTMKLVRHDRRGYYLDVEEMPEYERPPMISLPEYKATHLLKDTPA